MNDMSAVQKITSDLEEIFYKTDLSPLDGMKSMISSKAGETILAPYVPFIGKDFAKYRILIYATAQNISQGEVFDWFDFPIRRLYRCGNINDDSRESAKLSDIPIEPWSRGVLPALVGMLLLAKFGQEIDDLKSIQKLVAVTNYYKFSLSDCKKDINPSKPKLQEVLKEKYFPIGESLVKCELDGLRPKHLIWFNGPHKNFLINKCKESGIEQYVVNDPAWIVRWRHKCLKRYGNWWKKVESAKSRLGIDPKRFENAEELVRGYLPQIHDLNEKEMNGKAGKYGTKRLRELIICYLLSYYLQFIKKEKT